MLLYRSGTGRHRWNECALGTEKKTDYRDAEKIQTYLREKSAAAVGADYKLHDGDDEKTATTTDHLHHQQDNRNGRHHGRYYCSTTIRARLLVPRPPASTRQLPRSFGLVCQSPSSAGPATAATTWAARVRHRTRPFPVGPIAVTSL